MTDTHQMKLSEKAQSIVENIACRVADTCGGTISPNHVLPYLPVSLDVVRSALDRMADGTSVTAVKNEDFVTYEFSASKNAESTASTEQIETCAGCDARLGKHDDTLLCENCAGLLDADLKQLAETTGWPALAAHEHNFLYHAAEHDGTVHAETLAASSPYTLRNTRKKLDALVVSHYASQKLDEEQGVVKYSFPAITYPRDRYDSNMDTITMYPASIQEEIELKVARILLAAGILVGSLLVLAFFGIPFPMLLAIAGIGVPALAVVIWRQKTNIKE